MMESTYSVSSLQGLVSSKRRLVLPPNSSASPKFRQMDLAWPRCRYPLGSGGNRVCTRPPNLLVFRSSRTISRIKFEGAIADTSGGSLGIDGFIKFSVLDRKSVVEGEEGVLSSR